jgi:hypothetical protein
VDPARSSHGPHQSARSGSSGNTHVLLASGTILFERAWRAVSEESMVTLGCLLVSTSVRKVLAVEEKYT